MGCILSKRKRYTINSGDAVHAPRVAAEIIDATNPIENPISDAPQAAYTAEGKVGHLSTDSPDRGWLHSVANDHNHEYSWAMKVPDSGSQRSTPTSLPPSDSTCVYTLEENVYDKPTETSTYTADTQLLKKHNDKPPKPYGGLPVLFTSEVNSTDPADGRDPLLSSSAPAALPCSPPPGVDSEPEPVHGGSGSLESFNPHVERVRDANVDDLPSLDVAPVLGLSHTLDDGKPVGRLTLAPLHETPPHKYQDERAEKPKTKVNAISRVKSLKSKRKIKEVKKE